MPVWDSTVGLPLVALFTLPHLPRYTFTPTHFTHTSIPLRRTYLPRRAFAPGEPNTAIFSVHFGCCRSGGCCIRHNVMAVRLPTLHTLPLKLL